MEDNSFSTLFPLKFDGDNYQAWVVKMEAFVIYGKQLKKITTFLIFPAIQL